MQNDSIDKDASFPLLRKKGARSNPIINHSQDQKWSLQLLDLILSLCGTLIIALSVPWDLVLSTSLPGGGDNPAHPVLMASLADSFFSHASIIHYSYQFWAGFEAFQFYFPLPYLFAAALSKLINPNIAYKLTTIIGPLFLPCAWYFACRWMGMTRTIATFASILSVSFLMTKAHVMWGGNFSSDLAGMIANSWGFIFFTLAFGRLFWARREKRFSLLAVVLVACAALCHFYTFLMLAVVCGAYALEDCILVITKRTSIKLIWQVYACLGLAALLIAWWILPLYYYRPMSAEFGGNWHIDLLHTVSKAELTFFCVSILIAIGSIFFDRSRSAQSTHTCLFALLCLALYSSAHFFGSVAFSNVRLWPSLYFSLHFIALAAGNYLLLSKFRLWSPLYFGFLIALVPSDFDFFNKKVSMTWNFAGIESKRGSTDFAHLIQTLNAIPPTRISFESSDQNNGLLGSVRAFEILPYITKHEIIEGGIVNSASYPGIGYFLQCLTSNSCAGWPPASIVPGKDLARSLDFMRATGIQYHIAQRPEIIAVLKAMPEIEIIYESELLALFHLRQESPLVEVYDRPLPVIDSEIPLFILANLPRWDSLRHAGFIFNSRDVPFMGRANTHIDPVAFTNYLITEWQKRSARTTDRGWELRVPPEGVRFLNAYLFTFRSPFSLESALTNKFAPIISDRSFAADLLVANISQGNSELAIPLLRTEEGLGTVHIDGRGYKAFWQNKEFALNQDIELQFKKHELRGVEAPFELIRFEPITSEEYHEVEVSTRDPLINAGLPGKSEVPIAQPITSTCKVSLDKDFHQMRLHTSCPGKPHLIKYSYYPKWKAEVPIALGSNGFMVLTPEHDTTIISHTGNLVDYVGMVISMLGGVAFLGIALYRVRT